MSASGACQTRARCVTFHAERRGVSTWMLGSARAAADDEQVDDDARYGVSADRSRAARHRSRRLPAGPDRRCAAVGRLSGHGHEGNERPAGAVCLRPSRVDRGDGGVRGRPALAGCLTPSAAAADGDDLGQWTCAHDGAARGELRTPIFRRLQLTATTPLVQVVRELNAFHPQWLSAYPSIAALLAGEQLRESAHHPARGARQQRAVHSCHASPHHLGLGCAAV